MCGEILFGTTEGAEGFESMAWFVFPVSHYRVTDRSTQQMV
jgi:hypothetical protein